MAVVYDEKHLEEALLGVGGALVTLLAAPVVLLDPKGGEKLTVAMKALVISVNYLLGALIWFGAPGLLGTVNAVVAGFQGFGNPITAAVGPLFESLVTGFLTSQKTLLDSGTTVDPAQWESAAANALGGATLFGLGSFAVSAAFEALLPKRLNTLNSVGPILATLAGFGEVIGEILGPQYKAAFGRLSEYDANQRHRTLAPEGMLAEEMYARGSSIQNQYQKLINGRAHDGVMSRRSSRRPTGRCAGC